MAVIKVLTLAALALNIATVMGEPTATYEPAACGKEGQPVCIPPFTDREYECDFGYVGKEGLCTPYMPPPMPMPMPMPAPVPGAAPEMCGEGGEPVCKPPFVGRMFECNQGFVGEGEGEERMCVAWKAPEECGLDQQPVCEGTRFECKFGFVGMAAVGGRICVPYQDVDPDCPADCGSDGQPVCNNNPECCYGYMGANVRGGGRMCVPYVAEMVTEPEPVMKSQTVMKSRKLLADF